MDTAGPVTLIAPAERGSVRLARLLAAGVAADAGLSIDDTEDLRIAVSELVALLVDGSRGIPAPIDVRFHRGDGEVVVEGHFPAATPQVAATAATTATAVPASRIAGAATRAGSDDQAVVDDLVLEILRVVVDDHSFDAGADGRRFRLVKRTRAAS